MRVTHRARREVRMVRETGRGEEEERKRRGRGEERDFAVLYRWIEFANKNVARRS